MKAALIKPAEVYQQADIQDNSPATISVNVKPFFTVFL